MRADDDSRCRRDGDTISSAEPQIPRRMDAVYGASKTDTRTKMEISQFRKRPKLADAARENKSCASDAAGTFSGQTRAARDASIAQLNMANFAHCTLDSASEPIKWSNRNARLCKQFLDLTRSFTAINARLDATILSTKARSNQSAATISISV